MNAHLGLVYVILTATEQLLLMSSELCYVKYMLYANGGLWNFFSAVMLFCQVL